MKILTAQKQSRFWAVVRTPNTKVLNSRTRISRTPGKTPNSRSRSVSSFSVALSGVCGAGQSRPKHIKYSSQRSFTLSEKSNTERLDFAYHASITNHADAKGVKVRVFLSNLAA